jgi:hypothetical protein
MDLEGGKRRRSHGRKMMNKTHKRGKANNMLKSWVSFVKKIQKDENIPSYKDAITRASKRKGEWKKGMMGGMSASSPMATSSPMGTSSPMPSAASSSMSPSVISDMTGGRKSRRRRRSRCRK